MSNGEPNNKSKHEASQTEKHDYEESVSSGKQVEKTASNRMAASNQSDYYIKQANQNNSRIHSSVQSRLLLITQITNGKCFKWRSNKQETNNKAFRSEQTMLSSEHIIEQKASKTSKQSHCNTQNES
jgi:hypothetical protein